MRFRNLMFDYPKSITRIMIYKGMFYKSKYSILAKK